MTNPQLSFWSWLRTCGVCHGARVIGHGPDAVLCAACDSTGTYVDEGLYAEWLKDLRADGSAQEGRP